MAFRLLLNILLAVILAVPVAAQNGNTPLTLPRLSGPITLDGVIDEPAWESIAPLPLTTYQPTFEGPINERTEIRIAYDDDYLYVGGKLYDSVPEGMRANTLYRDRYSGDDTFAIILDTFNDNENALWFFTTPAGVRFDMTVSNDAQFGGGSPFGTVVNDSWNTFWDVATQQTDEGWFAEFRIPYSSLAFQDVDGRVTMGLITYRFIARTNERYIFPAIPPNWGMGFAKPSQAQKVILEGVQSQKPLYITPYVSGGVGQQAVLNNAGTRYLTDRNNTREVGLDLKYNLTSNLTLDLTANTDFAQVEADDQQVNLTRFSLFFPEKRQFFQERAGIFEFQTGRLDRLFHSRSIGLSSDGPVRIFGGARMVGRVGDWDVGFLDLQTQAQFGLPSENFGVLRLRRQVFNENSYAGGLVTSRLGDDGTYNVAYGLDGIIRLIDQDYLTLQWAQSLENEILDAPDANLMQSGLFRAELERRNQTGFNYRASLTWSGADYNPGMGFVTRRDFTNPSVRLSYGWFASDASPIRRISASLFSSIYFRNADSALDSFFGGMFWTFDLKSGAIIRLSPRLLAEDLTSSLSFSDDTVVPAGRYLFPTIEASFMAGQARLLRWDLDAEGGAFYDGTRITLKAAPTWNLSRHFELSGEYEFNTIDFPDRDQGFDAHIVRLRTQVGLNTKISTNAFIQYNSAADGITTNVRFRYNFREGNDLWIVYNEGLNLDRTRLSPMLPLTDTRTLLIKYTYTFRV